MKIINWVITSKCNYNCHFCKDRHLNRDSLPKENFLKIIDFINNINPKNILLFGGEPTLYEYIIDVFKYLNPNIKIIIQTNLSCCLEELENYFKIRKNIYFNITYHAQFEKNNEEYFNKLNYIYKKNRISYVNMVFENIDYQYIKEYYYEMYKNIEKSLKGIYISICNYDHIPLDPEVKKLFCYHDKKNQLKTIIPPKGSFIDCYKNKMTIDYNGNVFLCLSESAQNHKKGLKIFPLYNCIKEDSIRYHKLFYKILSKCKCDWCCKNINEI